MSVVTRLSARDFRPQPWKNGGGVTTELAVHPAQGRPLWRVSVAQVDRDGPFSDFSGYERTLLMLEGDGMVLSFDGAEPVRIDARYVPFTFDGALRCDCWLLGGPVRDMNLMVDREEARGTVEVLRARQPFERRLRADWTLVHVLAGEARARMGDVSYSLSSGDLLRIDGASDVALSLDCDGRDPALAMLEVQRQRR